MKSRNHHIGIYLVILLLLLFSANRASADDPDALVRIDCNTKTLQIEEYLEGDSIQELPSALVINMRGLMWVEELSDGTFTWKEEPERRVCRVNGTEYILDLKGYKYSTNPNAECGAGTPTLSLTIYKNQKLIARDLIFDLQCSIAGVGVILSIKLDPQKPYAELLIKRDKWYDKKEKVLVPVDKGITRQIIFNER
jgi:hypothetical protein